MKEQFLIWEVIQPHIKPMEKYFTFDFIPKYVQWIAKVLTPLGISPFFFVEQHVNGLFKGILYQNLQKKRTNEVKWKIDKLNYLF